MQFDTHNKPDAFDVGMRYSSAYRERSCLEIWELYRKRYLEFKKFTKTTQNIPKKLHQIWLGSNLPDIYNPLIEKLRDLHPDWEYKLWTDRDVADFDFHNKDLFVKSKNFGQKSDILRYEILNSFGGIYLDLDFIAIKPLDSLRALEAFAGIAYDSEPNLLNGVIGCIPNSRFSNNLINIKPEEKNSSAMEIVKTTGPYFMSNILYQEIKLNPLCLALPNSYFYAFPNFPKDRTLGNNFESYLGPNSYACHLWHCSWLKIKPVKKSKKFFTLIQEWTRKKLKNQGARD